VLQLDTTKCNKSIRILLHFLEVRNLYIWAILRQNSDPSLPIIKSWKTFANLVYFKSSGCTWTKKIQKWKEKFYEVGPLSAQSDTCFLVQNRSFLHIFTFHLEKHIRKTWNFAQLELMYVILRENYKTLKIRIFVEQSSRANSTMFFETWPHKLAICEQDALFDFL
jgi:hypothetical protein